MALSDFIEEALGDSTPDEGPGERITRLAKSAVDRIASVLPELKDVLILDTSAVHHTVRVSP